MKKYIIIALAALAASVACSKVDTIDVQREISFEVAKGVQTKALGSIYDNGAFGTYAWYNGNDGSNTEFMVNETVDLIGGVWKTKYNTFYWPKTGNVEFISYSPFAGLNNVADTIPAITRTTIQYKGISTVVDATHPAVDYMYADKATATRNVDSVLDSLGRGAGNDSGYSGVPTIFRHALAKVSFKLKANFVRYIDTTSATNDTTRWDVTVTSAKIFGFKTKGDCLLTLNQDYDGTVVPWNKPDTTVAGVKYNVWTNLSGSSEKQELIDTVTTYPSGVKFYYDVAEDKEYNDAQDLAAAAGFVMPQVLESNTQKLELKIHIKTYLSNGKTIEEDYNPVLDIKNISTLKAWQMNQNIVYTISIKPTAIADPNNNDNPNDVIITFDPAVADWTNVDAAATIQL